MAIIMFVRNLNYVQSMFLQSLNENRMTHISKSLNLNSEYGPSNVDSTVTCNDIMKFTAYEKRED